MRDKTSKKGFFSLTKMKNWLTNLLMNLNPPLASVPIRVRVLSNNQISSMK